MSAPFGLGFTPLIGFTGLGVTNALYQRRAAWVEFFCPLDGLSLSGPDGASPFRVRPSHGIITFGTLLDEQTLVWHSE